MKEQMTETYAEPKKRARNKFGMLMGGLLFISLVLVITGVAMGGSLINFRGGLGFSTGSFYFTDLQLANSDAEVEGDSLYEGVVNLRVESGAISTLIKEWDGSGINVDTSNLSRNARRQLNVSQNGDTLNISSGDFGRIQIFGLNFTSDILVIQVPVGFEFESVHLDTGAGHLKLEYLIAEELEVSIGAGQLDATNLFAQQLLVNIGAGQGEIERFEADDAKLSVGAGQLNATGIIHNHADLDCSVGEIVLDVLGRQEDFAYSVSLGIGEATFGGRTIAGLGGEFSGNLEMDRRIDVNVGIGSVTVNFR